MIGRVTAAAAAAAAGEGRAGLGGTADFGEWSSS